VNVSTRVQNYTPGCESFFPGVKLPTLVQNLVVTGKISNVKMKSYVFILLAIGLASAWNPDTGCQIFLGEMYQNGKNLPKSKLNYKEQRCKVLKTLHRRR
jgi:hypothetical protein